MTRHHFDGHAMTVTEIHALLPALSETTIRRHLKAGRCTRAAMLAYDPATAYRNAGKRSAKTIRARGWGFS